MKNVECLLRFLTNRSTLNETMCVCMSVRMYSVDAGINKLLKTCYKMEISLFYYGCYSLLPSFKFLMCQEVALYTFWSVVKGIVFFFVIIWKRPAFVLLKDDGVKRWRWRGFELVFFTFKFFIPTLNNISHGDKYIIILQDCAAIGSLHLYHKMDIVYKFPPNYGVNSDM